MTAQRPSFTKDQLNRYFDRLKLPGEHRKFDVTKVAPEDALLYLGLLQKLHLAEIPFENLALHYSQHRQISIHPEELYKKIIADDNGRGGYCMENNCLMGVLLNSIGFQVYSAGARVWNGEDWTGWSHMVNIVTIENSRYFVDVGFGSNGPIRPLLLDRSGVEQNHISPALMRLQWRNITGNQDSTQRLWVYEHSFDRDSDFIAQYCFTELEFLPCDYHIMNYYTSTHPKTIFTQAILFEKKILGGHDNEELIGSVIMGNDIKWRIHGEKKSERKFENEDDRIEAIQKDLGIKLSQVERDSIRGSVTEIKKQGEVL